MSGEYWKSIEHNLEAYAKEKQEKEAANLAEHAEAVKMTAHLFIMAP